MEKKVITFQADGQVLLKTDTNFLFASNIVSYINAEFTLGDNWTGFDAVRAVWKTATDQVAMVLDEEGKCEVPAEVLRYPSRVLVNLVGSTVVDGALQDRLTTYPCHAFTIDQSTHLEGTETPSVTPSQFDQYVSMVKGYWEDIHDYRRDAEAWAIGERNGEPVAEDDDTYQNNSKYYADQANESAQQAHDDLIALNEHIAENVDEWLTEHPEATTTVQDGSLTEVKFSDALKLKAIKDYVTPEMFGAKGDGIADDTEAINNAIAFAISSKTGLLLVNTYAFSEPILVQSSVDIYSGAKGFLKYTGTDASGFAITFDGQGSRETFTNSYIKLRIIRNTDLYGIGGVCIKNCLHNMFDIMARGFSIGLQVLGDLYDCDYNTIFPTLIEDNKVGINLTTSPEGGAVNQNTFIGGSVRVSSSTISMLEEEDYFSDLILQSNSTHVANNNTFLSVSFESYGENRISAIGYYNMFVNCRFEGITDVNITGYGSAVIGGYGFENFVPSNSAIAIGRNNYNIPLEDKPFIVRNTGSAQYYLSLINSSNVPVFRVASSGDLFPKGNIHMNYSAHNLATVFGASDDIPSVYTYGHYGSVHMCASGSKAGRRLRVREGDKWENILYSYADTTSNRPTSDIAVGYMMFDTTLGKPIWYKGSNVWVDATGGTV